MKRAVERVDDEFPAGSKEDPLDLNEVPKKKQKEVIVTEDRIIENVGVLYCDEEEEEEYNPPPRGETFARIAAFADDGFYACDGCPTDAPIPGRVWFVHDLDPADPSHQCVPYAHFCWALCTGCLTRHGANTTMCKLIHDHSKFK